jgi:gluconate kinase
MKSNMLESQFAALEEPQGAIVIDAEQPLSAIVKELCAAINQQ